MELTGLNPLEIGSICNKIPIKNGNKKSASIPLKSGLFVIEKLLSTSRRKNSLNPLEIGSICNNDK